MCRVDPIRGWGEHSYRLLRWRAPHLICRGSYSSSAENKQRATMQTPQGLDATHRGELFPHRRGGDFLDRGHSAIETSDSHRSIPMSGTVDVAVVDTPPAHPCVKEPAPSPSPGAPRAYKQTVGYSASTPLRPLTHPTMSS